MKCQDQVGINYQEMIYDVITEELMKKQGPLNFTLRKKSMY